MTDIILEEDNEELNVISINSRWGTGKTTFIKMWERYLKDQNIKTIYFNSWENDDNDNPIFSLIMQLEKLYIRSGGKIEEIKTIIEKMPSCLYHLGKGFLANFISVSTGGLVDKEMSLKSINELENSNNGYRLYEEEKERIKFKKDFRDFLENISKDNRIFFFIDELDRCRPNYAIKMLEIIKHYFEIKNIVFVLSIDMEQLSHSISTTYGQNMDSGGYLKRFIDYEVELPKLNLTNLLKELINENRVAFDVMRYFIHSFDFSLRDLEKLGKNKKIKRLEEINGHGDIYWIKLMFACYFLCLKIKKPLKYYSFINKNSEDNNIFLEELEKNISGCFDFLKNNFNNVGESDPPNKLNKLKNEISKREILKKLLAPYIERQYNFDAIEVCANDGEYIKLDVIKLYEGAVNRHTKMLDSVPQFIDILK